MRSFAMRSDPSKFISAAWQQNHRSFSVLARATISEEARRNFVNLTDGLMTTDPYGQFLEASQNSGSVLEKVLAIETKEVLREFGKKGISVVLLQNCPIIGTGDLPPTPTVSAQPSNKDWVSEYFMLGLANLIGAKPYSVAGVRDGKVITQLIPLEPRSNSGSGSKIPFNLHNEVVHEPSPPDFFLLLCLRGNPMAKTTYCFLEDIINLLPPEIISELEKPNFLMKSGDPAVFKNYQEHRCSVLTRDPETGNCQIRLNTALGRCEGLTPEAKDALKYINNCLEGNIKLHGISLSRGDALLINNKQTLHGRTAFDVSVEEIKAGTNRWIQRMNLNREIENFGKGR